MGNGGQGGRIGSISGRCVLVGSFADLQIIDHLVISVATQGLVKNTSRIGIRDEHLSKLPGSLVTTNKKDVRTGDVFPGIFKRCLVMGEDNHAAARVFVERYVP